MNGVRSVLNLEKLLLHLRLLRPVRADRLWPTATAVGKLHLVGLQARVSGRQKLTDYFCRLSRGSFFVLLRFPMAVAMGHILPPLRGLPLLDHS